VIWVGKKNDFEHKKIFFLHPTGQATEVNSGQACPKFTSGFFRLYILVM
jgi:hypothetical protein